MKGMFGLSFLVAGIGLSAASAHVQAQPDDSLTFADLAAVAKGGLVKEEVLQVVHNINVKIETALQDRIGSKTVKSHKFDWLHDSDDTPSDSSAAEATDYPAGTSATGGRKNNYTQYNLKAVNVSQRNLRVDIHGRSDEMGYQTAKKIRVLQRDIETRIVDGNNASVADDGAGTKGQTAPLAVQIETNVVANGVTGGGYNSTTGLFTANTVGTAGPVQLAFSDIRDMIEDVYLLGGNLSLLTSHPSVTKRIGEYLVGTPAAFVPITGNSEATKPQTLTANGYVEFFKTDFGQVIQVLPNRSQRGYNAPVGTVATDAAHVFLLDPSTIDVVYIDGIQVEPLAKLGIYTRKGVFTDWGLRVNDERANAVIKQVSLTQAVTAT